MTNAELLIFEIKKKRSRACYDPTLATVQQSKLERLKLDTAEVRQAAEPDVRGH